MDNAGLKKGYLELMDYQDNYPEIYEKEKEELLSIYKNRIAIIDHVGSTSIKGIMSKPIIDILVQTNNLEDFKNYTEANVEGEVYTVKKEPTMGGDYLIRKEEEGKVKAFIHVYQTGDIKGIRSIIFRDYLNSNEEERNRYNELKIELCKNHKDDRKSYTYGKKEYIDNVIDKAIKEKTFAIIEIGSGNTKLHIYGNSNLLYEKVTTIQFKRNYKAENKIINSDLEKLYQVIEKAQEYTPNVHIYGCSIFRTISEEELNEINDEIDKKFQLKIEVVTQEDEAQYTALGCYGDNDYKGTICIFIGGGGSIELVFVKDKQIIDKKYYGFGVVDITHKFESLKEDVPEVSLEEVLKYVDELIGDINTKADVMVLSGGDHIYWYKNAQYKLLDNNIYNAPNQKYILTIQMSDEYDKDTYVTSLDTIRNNSDNPEWFDGCRAMKAITNNISHKIGAKYIVPTSINMEDGIKNKLLN